jgi:ribosome-associated protein
MEIVDFELRGEHIALDALLKAVGLSGSGGAAKAMVASGKVQVDGREELRKTCKIRAGQVVSITGHRIRIHAAAPAAVVAGSEPADPVATLSTPEAP